MNYFAIPEFVTLTSRKVDDDRSNSAVIRKILFPVDFSPACVGMAAYVRQAAETFSAQVTILHVCDLESHNGFELYVRPAGEISEEHWEIGRSKLDRFLRSEFPKETCPRVLLAGDASTLIVAAAKKHEADLIIMPTHAGRFRRMLLGSTTTRVLNEADCPVLTTQNAATIAPRPVEHKVWLCGISLKSDSQRVLRLANHAASQAGAKLAVVHVIPEFDLQTWAEREQVTRDRISELQLGSVVLLLYGAVKEQLLKAAKESSADVLVVGRKPCAPDGARIRRLIYPLVRESPCPVVSV